jgi:hypothetical protein
LPQDFGINVATLLSNEGRHTLKLAKCPRLLDLLLGHAGVFNHRKILLSFFISVKGGGTIILYVHLPEI